MDIQYVKFDTEVHTKNVGSKFGAALAAVDINADGIDELFIGAPLQNGKNTEEGRVYVFTASNGVNF